MKEADEEIRLEINPENIVELCTLFIQPRDPVRQFFNKYFLLVAEAAVLEQLNPDPAEIAELRWWSIEEIQQANAQDPGSFVEVLSKGTEQWQVFIEAFAQFKSNHGQE